MTATVVTFPGQAQSRRVGQVTSWNADEDAALEGLPHAAQIIYLRVMRRHMDYATGIVGQVRRIGYQQILERIDYTPPSGSRERPVRHSRDQVKRLIQRLVDAGLLVRLHDTSHGVAPMEFYLPLADADGVPEGVLAPTPAETTPPRENPHARASGEGNTATEGAEIPQGERHGSATGGAPRENPHARASGEGNTATGAPREERHPSGTSGVVDPDGSTTRRDARENATPDPTPDTPPADKAKAKSRTPKPRPDAAIQSQNGTLWGTADDLALAEWMAEQVDALPGGAENRSMADWANTIRLMRERDGREHRHIRALFAWANADEFWQANIRSPRKLRAQWKQLAIKRNREYQRAKAQEAAHAQQTQGRQPGAGRRRLSAQEARAQAEAQRRGGAVYEGECTPGDGDGGGSRV